MQEFKTGATRQNMETTHMKEETKRLRSQLSELREKLADLDAKVTYIDKVFQSHRAVLISVFLAISHTPV